MPMKNASGVSETAQSGHVELALVFFSGIFDYPIGRKHAPGSSLRRYSTSGETILQPAGNPVGGTG